MEGEGLGRRGAMVGADLDDRVWRLSAIRTGKEIILTMTKTDVEVDAVSADVGDAPMRQRQYTAPVQAPSA